MPTESRVTRSGKIEHGKPGKPLNNVVKCLRIPACLRGSRMRIACPVEILPRHFACSTMARMGGRTRHFVRNQSMVIIWRASGGLKRWSRSIVHLHINKLATREVPLTLPHSAVVWYFNVLFPNCVSGRYFYLIFADPQLVNLNENVFTTEVRPSTLLTSFRGF